MSHAVVFIANLRWKFGVSLGSKQNVHHPESMVAEGGLIQAKLLVGQTIHSDCVFSVDMGLYLRTTDSIPLELLISH